MKAFRAELEVMNEEGEPTTAVQVHVVSQADEPEVVVEIRAGGALADVVWVSVGDILSGARAIARAKPPKDVRD